MKFSIPIIVCLTLVSTVATAGETTDNKKYKPMTAKQFQKMLPGNTIIGEYRQMRERTKTYNFSEFHHKDGGTDYTEGAVKAKGVWYTLGKQKICYKYPNEESMGAGISCFWVYKQDTCYYGYGIGNMTLNGPRRFEDWSARWVVKGSGGTCDAPVS